MKQALLWLFGLEDYQLEDPAVIAGIIASFALIAACIAVFIILAAKKRLRIHANGVRVWNKTRNILQGIWAVLTNSFMVGWFKGTIYQGKLKYMCVPGMNCYSCPGAWGACPIGSLQAVLDEFDAKSSWKDPETGYYVKAPKYYFAFYVIGFIMIVGALCGRLVCGILCPFGWIQDLLYKIPVKKLKVSRDPAKIKLYKNPGLAKFALGLDRVLRYFKYAFLIVMVVCLPLLYEADPWFCKYVCPSGMLLGGIPLMSMNKGLAEAAGSLTALKLSILGFLVVLSVFLYRPFCRYICPLGALYSLFNPISLYRYGIVDSKCNRSKGCSACRNACPMGIDPVKTPNSPECIRCGTCNATCPQKAINAGVRFKTVDGEAVRTRRVK